MTERQGAIKVRAGLQKLAGAFRFGWVFWLATILLFVFSLPHVIALRNLLMLALLAMVARHLSELRAQLRQPAMRVIAVCFGALLAWMIFVSLALAPAAAESLRSFVGDWVRALVAIVTGCGVALALRRLPGSQMPALVAAVIFIATMAQVLGHDIVASLRWLDRGDLPTRFPGITDHRANVTHVFALLLSVIGADLCSRYLKGRPLLMVGPRILGLSAALGFFAMLTSSTTNGWIVAMLLILLVVALVLTLKRADGRQSRFQRNVLVACGLGFVVFGAVAVVNDPRYDGFVETVGIAWDTEHNRQWLDAEQTDQWPLRANGEEVDPSTYSRVAWAKEGVVLLLEHPFGTEISKHTYERLIRDKYGVAYMAHSHVGLIDFGLNVGFPGIGLWLVFLAGLMYLGADTYRRTGNAIGLALLFMVTAFSIRMLLDSTLRDHLLEQFMFCAGLLAAACAAVRSQERVSP